MFGMFPSSNPYTRKKDVNAVCRALRDDLTARGVELTEEYYQYLVMTLTETNSANMGARAADIILAYHKGSRDMSFAEFAGSQKMESGVVHRKA